MLNRTILVVVGICLLQPLAAQSKKELRRQVAQLQQQLDSLNDHFEPDLENETDKISYAFGSNVAQGMAQQGLLDSLNIEAIYAAFLDVTNENPQMTQEESGTLIKGYLEEAQARMLAKQKEKSQKFLKENAQREEVTQLPSGLQYEVLKEGEGEKPSETDRVSTHYEGKLLDGTVFDSSYERGEPVTLPVNGVIKGWTEALQLMKTGAKWRLYIPSELAYGERGAGQDIPPHAALIFDVELLSIEQ